MAQDAPPSEEPSNWIVICPDPYVTDGLWKRWYQAKCVAVGWPPPNWTLEGPSDTHGWTYARNRLKRVRPGDKVIPFLLKWRIGPVGSVREINVGDTEWNATVVAPNHPWDPPEELGRRILVTWESSGMPPNGRVALIPLDQRSGGPLAKHTIEALTDQRFRELCSVLSDPTNWIDIIGPGSQADSEVEVPPKPLPVEELAVLERDLQRFLSRNLSTIEKGLKPDPDYQLEEYPIDIGRMDLLCKDGQGNWVVIELKADWAGDDAVGQILGYMNWVKENLPNGSSVRGILVCKNATGRVKMAIKWVPSLRIKRFNLSFNIGDMD